MPQIMSKHSELLKDFGYAAQSARTVDALMDLIVEKLHGTMTRYNWVGFYLVDKTRPGSLNLGPHVGSFEPHENVSLDKGLWGEAASSKKTVVVNNAADDPRYKASSSLVKSEIVVPIFTRGALYGEIDINSYFANTFTFEEQQFVEACGTLVSGYLEKPR
ncbi:MAG TPA: GAF domain-containing protein [Candidatus Acidoferrum sp.]|nr:GAF domain-containing protein [Candidatus Acidoferrum sp.]